MSLWDEARDILLQRLREQGEDREAIDQFLQDKTSVEDARRSAEDLCNDSDRKYGMNESRSKGLSGKWIRRIMENLDKFTSFGDVAMTAAPESVGLAWFAISQVLGAIQNDYKLYGIFNAALNDITEMMVLVRTYDKIYDGQAMKGDGSIYEELLKGIRELYTSILDFSFAVKKHITAGKRSKIVHALKDTVGALNRLFTEKIKTIQNQKTKVIEYSEAAFQEKTTDQLGSVSGELVAIQNTMLEVYHYHQQSSNEWREVLSELKVSKITSHRDLAVTEHEKNMNLLVPWLDGSDASLQAHIKDRQAGTCDWINAVPEFCSWRDSKQSAILCVTGESGGGKSVLGRFVWEHLQQKTNGKDHVQYVTLDVKSVDDGENAVDRIDKTIIRDIYSHALDDTDDDFLLQKCNELFLHPKQLRNRDNSSQARALARSRNTTDDLTPDLLDVYPELLDIMQKQSFLILDTGDGLSEKTSAILAERLIRLKDISSPTIRVLLLCRSSSHIQNKMEESGVLEINIGDHNGDDIRALITSGLEKIPSLSQIEKAEIEEAIVQKTGHRIRYVTQVAIPFLQTPLRRPIVEWLDSLPENVNETYHQHLVHLAPGYRPLLQIALSWTLVAQTPLHVEEIIDAYSRIYLDGDASERQSWNSVDLDLYQKQIRIAGGPFLEIRDHRDVVLQDARAARSFCSTIRKTLSDTVDEQPTCAKCKSRFFSQSLAEANIRAQAKQADTEKTGTLSQTEEEAAKEEANSSVDDPVSAGSNQNEDKGSQEEKNTRNGTAQDGEASEPEEEKDDDKKQDDDDSVFSEQNEDLDPPIDDGSWALNEYQRDRYEIGNWYFHVREAERLWTASERHENPEWQVLLDEMENFFLGNPVAFEAWKLKYVPYHREQWEPLLFAAAYGLTSLAGLLIDKGAKVMDLTPEGYCALHIASEAPNQLEMLKLLLHHGGDPNFEGSKIPPFHDWFAFTADPKCVQELLSRGASCTMGDKYGWTALHYCAQSGSDRDILELLLDHIDVEGKQVDINVKDKDGEVPLHKLLRRKDIPMEMLKCFLERGADVNIDSKTSERPLFEAALYGENEAIEAIMDRVTDINDDHDRGRTALHAAAWTGQRQTVELLIKHNADVNLRDKHNRTPLFLACLNQRRWFLQEGGAQATAELLVQEQIDRGASFEDINPSTTRGRTPLREAAGRGFVKVVTSILDKMTPGNRDCINRQDFRKGRSPLHSAAVHGRGEVVALLLGRGADPKLREGVDGKGMTSLEVCLDRWASLGLQRYEGAIVHLIDAEREEAKANKLLLTTAAINGSVAVLEKLASIGANLDLPDPYGWTPAQLARQFGHPRAAEFIKETLARQAIRPTRWVLEDEPKNIIISDDGLQVSYQDGPRFITVADHPVPAGLAQYYYEVEILDPKTGEILAMTTSGKQDAAIVGLGFCTSPAKTMDFPGWAPKNNAPNARSWAYYADDGGFFDSHSQQRRFGPHYGPGDIVGCGLDFEDQKIFFTRNGEELTEHYFQRVKGRVFPVLGLEHTMQLRTNFGASGGPDFKWRGRKAN
ncbi:MAG: hypothetical protein M1821_009038 [Bathelium mastoideum]|nr:MAG: hypothetical protein M1821_009038 [Bathelium mastoideum]